MDERHTKKGVAKETRRLKRDGPNRKKEQRGEQSHDRRGGAILGLNMDKLE